MFPIKKISKTGRALLVILSICSTLVITDVARANATTVSFAFTGSTQTWTVPAGVTSITFDISGAGGLNANYSGCEALGGRVQGTMSVTAGAVLTIVVGGKATGQSGGYNGGGNGARPGAGGGGGGATDIRNSGGTKLAIAGGAGGTGNNVGCGSGSGSDIGGVGGGLTGGSAPGTGRGTGGTSTAGGTGGSYYGTAENGSLGQGGKGYIDSNGGGGGGGYYGGGGGSWAGGGGGSSYTDPGTITSVTHTQGFRAGNGVATVSYGPAPDTTAPTFTSTSTFTVSENILTSANAATIKVSESSTITATAGSDLARFDVVYSDSITVFIRFKVSPNFEAPADVGTNNVYELTLRAVDTAGNIQTQAITISVTDLSDTSFFISLTINAPPIFSTDSVITAVFSSPARVTFRINNSFIPGCRNRPTSGTSPNIVATCTWKPPRRGALTITAIGTPIDSSISGASSSPLNVAVGNRTNRR